MGLVGAMLAGGVAGGADSLSRSIDKSEDMAYRNMLEQQRMAHQEYLTRLQNQFQTQRDETQNQWQTQRDETQRNWKNEDAEVGRDVATGMPIQRKDVKDGQVVMSDKEYEANRPLSGREQQLFDAEMESKGAETKYKNAMADQAKYGKAEATDFIKNYNFLAKTDPEAARKLMEKTVGDKEIDPYKRAMVVDKIQQILDNGDGKISEKNVSQINAMLRSIGEPTYERVFDKPGEKHLFRANDPDVYKYIQRDNPDQQPQGKGRNIEGSMIDAESNGNQNAVSPKGATGKTQLMPGTAKDLGVNPKDEFENVAGGISYLSSLRQKYGNDATALVAYNWGPGNADKWLADGADPAKLPRETRAYVAKVLQNTGRSQQGSGLVGDSPLTEQAKPEGLVGQVKSGNDKGAKSSSIWNDPNSMLAGSVDFGSLVGKPIASAGEYMGKGVSDTIAALSAIRDSLTEAEYQKALAYAQDENVDLAPKIKQLGIDGFRAWLDAANPAKNTERYMQANSSKNTNNLPELPRNPGSRTVGTKYAGPDGNAYVWDGKGLKRA